MREIIIGLILGFGKIVPGMSGSVLAISFNVYEKAINAFNDLKNYKNLLFLMKLGIGIIISIALFSNVVLYFFKNFKIETTFLFVGLILGSKEEIKKNTKIKYFYLTIISFILIVLFSLLKTNAVISIDNSIILYFISGIIESISSIIPGVSGTAMLMLIGTYDKVIYIFSNFFNISYMIRNLKIIIPFVIGIIIGLIVSVKMVNYLFSNYFYQSYNVILGFLYGSIFVMLISIQYTIFKFFISFLFLIVGYKIIKKVNHFF